MTSSAPPAPPRNRSHRATGWGRAAIIALGSAGCALSYDALQQMAAAVHVRGGLTYLFPLVIDGFIAYGVRALIILRTASVRSRLYVWTLFGTATTASIWANALHAVRLNQQAATGVLQLDDMTVAVLSTLAPLALAGAVHLYILIARHSTPGHRIERVVPRQAPEEQSLDSMQADEERPRHLRRVGRPPSAELTQLLNLARPLFETHEKPTRETVRHTIHTAGHSVSEDRLTKIMAALRTGSSSRTGD